MHGQWNLTESNAGPILRHTKQQAGEGVCAVVFGGEGRSTYRGRPVIGRPVILAQREKRARIACERARKRLASRLRV